MIYLSVDKIMLEHFVSSSAVAFYDQAEKIVKIPLTFITVLSTVMMPRLASQFADNNLTQMKNYLSKTIKFSSMLVFPGNPRNLGFVSYYSIKLIGRYIRRPVFGCNKANEYFNNFILLRSNS